MKTSLQTCWCLHPLALLTKWLVECYRLDIAFNYTQVLKSMCFMFLNSEVNAYVVIKGSFQVRNLRCQPLHETESLKSKIFRTKKLYLQFYTTASTCIHMFPTYANNIYTKLRQILKNEFSQWLLLPKWRKMDTQKWTQMTPYLLWDTHTQTDDKDRGVPKPLPGTLTYRQPLSKVWDDPDISAGLHTHTALQ